MMMMTKKKSHNYGATTRDWLDNVDSGPNAKYYVHIYITTTLSGA